VKHALNNASAEMRGMIDVSNIGGRSALAGTAGGARGSGASNSKMLGWTACDPLGLPSPCSFGLPDESDLVTDWTNNDIEREKQTTTSLSRVARALPFSAFQEEPRHA
jgi:hypothetical protein